MDEREAWMRNHRGIPANNSKAARCEYFFSHQFYHKIKENKLRHQRMRNAFTVSGLRKLIWLHTGTEQKSSICIGGNNMQWIGAAWDSWDRTWVYPSLDTSGSENLPKDVMSVLSDRFVLGPEIRERGCCLLACVLLPSFTWLKVLAVVKLSAWLCKYYVRLAKQRESLLHMLIKYTIRNHNQQPGGRFTQSMCRTIVLQGSFFTFTLWHFLALVLEME